MPKFSAEIPRQHLLSLTHGTTTVRRARIGLGKEEALAWGAQFNAHPNIPSDWKL